MFSNSKNKTASLHRYFAISWCGRVQKMGNTTSTNNLSKHGSPRTGAHLSWSTVLREPEHGSPRTGAHLSWRTGEHLSGEPENISMFSMFSMFPIFSAFSMFSICSELTPSAPIPDGRMERYINAPSSTRNFAAS